MSGDVTRRGPVHYLGLREQVAPEDVARVAARTAEVQERLRLLGVEPAGPAFLRYRVLEAPVLADVEACVPVPAALEVDDRTADAGFAAGLLPGGAYLCATAEGAADLDARFRDLLAAGIERGLLPDVDPAEHRWGGRIAELDDADGPVRVLIRLDDASAVAV